MSETSDPQPAWNESLNQVMEVMREFLKEIPKPAAVMNLKDVLLSQNGTDDGKHMTCLMRAVAVLRLCESETTRSRGSDSFSE